MLLFQAVVDDREIIHTAAAFLNEIRYFLLHFGNIVYFADFHIIRGIFFHQLELGSFVLNKCQELGISVVADIEIGEFAV